MINPIQIMREAWCGKRNVLVILLAGLVLFFVCSDDDNSVGPELAPRTLVEGISYLDVVSGDLKYVEKRGEFWGKPEVVTYSGYVGMYSSLAFDAQGVPHISYFDDSKTDLVYAVRTTDGWQRYTVDYDGVVGERCDIAVDAQGVPHISYCDGGRSIKYASLANGVWKTEEAADIDNMYQSSVNTLDCPESNFTRYRTSLAIDANGHPHIAYKTDGLILGYAVKTAVGDWSFKTMGNPIIGYDCPLALDVQGNPHICHQIKWNDEYYIKYLWNESGVWMADTITVGEKIHWCAQYCDIAMDSKGNPHIAFFTKSEHLGYLTKGTDGEWHYELVDGYGKIGVFVSIAVDDQGNPRISYYDCNNKCLKYAVKIDGGWACGVVDQMGNVGFFSSLAVSYQ